jgi:hypothetical protein
MPRYRPRVRRRRFKVRIMPRAWRENRKGKRRRKLVALTFPSEGAPGGYGFYSSRGV